MSRILSQPFALPCGVVIKNRIGKAPMTEGLADRWDRPSKELCQLYDRWAMGGSGLSVTGNVMIDHPFNGLRRLSHSRGYGRGGREWRD